MTFKYNFYCVCVCIDVVCTNAQYAINIMDISRNVLGT